MPKIIQFISLLCCIPVYIILYFMSKNIAEYEIREYIVTLFYVLSASFLALAINYAIARFSKLLAFFVGAVCFCLILMVVLEVSVLDGKWICSVLVSVGCFWSVFHLCKKNRLKPALLILVLMSLFSGGRYTYDILESHKGQQLEKKSLGEMEKKPNVYLIVLESYTGQECLKKRYDYDNKEFYQFLDNNGFKTYKNVYTTRPTTRVSLWTLLTMSNPRVIREPNLGRILRREYSSPVLDTFEKNGYSINLKFPSKYLGILETLERDRKKWSLYNSMFRKYLDIQYPKYVTFSDFTKAVEHDIEKLSLSKPVFFMTKIGGSLYKGGLEHSPPSLWRKKENAKLPGFREKYLDEMQKENPLIQDVLKKIIEKDKNAIIILVGDHGALLFNLWKKVGDYKHYGIPREEFVLDQFNVHLSIRLPEGMNLNAPNKKYYVFEIFQDVFDALIPTYKKNKIMPILYDVDGKPLK